MIPKRDDILINNFILTEAIIHISYSDLNEILKPVEKIKVDEETIEKLLQKLNNYTICAYKEGSFSDPYINPLLGEYLNSYTFESNYSRIFANLFIILSKLDITIEQFRHHRQPLIKFLKVYNGLYWHQLAELSNFLFLKGNLFETKDLIEILKIAINGDSYRYNTYRNLIEIIPQALLRFYPDYRISDVRLIKKSLFNSTSEDNDDRVEYGHLINLLNVCDENCRKMRLFKLLFF